jgi:hypothetical protein
MIIIIITINLINISYSFLLCFNDIKTGGDKN